MCELADAAGGAAGLATALGEVGVGVALLDADRRVVFATEEFQRLIGVVTPPLEVPFEELLVRSGAERLIAGTPVEDGRSGAGETAWYRLDGRLLRVRTGGAAGSARWAVCDDVTSLEGHDKPGVTRRDPLTGLVERTTFHEEIRRQVARGGADREVAVLYLDLDHFKTVNDTLGHPAGDVLLRQVADRLRGAVRTGDVIGRLGGDEFAVVQVGSSQPAGAVALARRLIDAVSQTYDVGGHRVDTATSVGMAIYPWDAVDADELVKHADLALYAAKREGRGGHQLYEPRMSQAMHARRDLEQDLRQALKADALQLHYQPLVDIADRQVQAMEALLRWTHPQRGVISPAEFIPIAEDSGLILELGRWVLMRACTDAMTWPVPVPVAVNVSPAQLHKRTLVRDVSAALASWDSTRSGSSWRSPKVCSSTTRSTRCGCSPS